MRLSRNCLAAFGTLATVLAAAGAIPTAAASTARDNTPPGMLAAMQRDLGLTAAQARTRLGQEATAVTVATQVRQRLGAAQAGYWFDAGAGSLAVAVTDQAAAAEVTALGAVPKLVRHSKAELDRIAGTLSKLAGKGYPGLTGWGIDATDNTVVITVNKLVKTPATDAFLSKARTLGDLVKVVEKSSSPVQQSGTVEGGNPWWPGAESNCSVAFPVTDSGGGKHFLSAGHCTNDADQPAYGASGQQNRIGTSNAGGDHSVNAAEGDFGLIDVDQSGWDLSSTVNGWGNGDVTVSGSAEAVKGQSVCHSGNTSHWQCGTVTDVDQSIDYGGGLVINGLTITSACSQAGDSGGAWVADTQAVGIHSGGSSSCGGSDQDSIFQPVGKALEKWDLTLETGGATATSPDGFADRRF
ncbi:S1 family peptidase [Amycolatopsis sp. NBC_00345]|uniref:S1 family peptidase n=1 Tax=Amycolatopsis sp. NBC_00345 TaxID=2975955 RepID=UPI002E26E108